MADSTQSRAHGERCHYRIKLFDNNENDNKPEILEVRWQCLTIRCQLNPSPVIILC